MSQLRLRHGPTTLCVHADATVLAWLEEFLAPAFARTDTPFEDTAIDVRFEVDADEHGRLERVRPSVTLAGLEGVPAWDCRLGPSAYETDLFAILEAARDG